MQTHPYERRYHRPVAHYVSFTRRWQCLQTVTFFTKFCILICSTIGFSLVAALLFFMPLVATLGPEAGFGDLRLMLAMVTGKNNKPAADTDTGQEP